MPTAKYLMKIPETAMCLLFIEVVCTVHRNQLRKWANKMHFLYTGYTQKNGAVSKINKKFIFQLTRAQRTPSAVATVHVSHALPAVRFSCLLPGRVASFQDGVAAGKGFLCAPF